MLRRKYEKVQLKFIDTNRLMSSALRKLVDNLSKIKDSDKETYEFIDNMRCTAKSLQSSINNYSDLN